MENPKSRAAVLSFLDYLAQKGLMAPATVSARKAATNKVLGILSETEAEDVTTIELDDVMRRFHNLEGKSYTPDSLQAYKSRVRSTLEDFASYVENPLAFRPGIQPRDKKPGPRKASASSDVDEATTTMASMKTAQATGPMSASILPIPLRVDLTVYVQGLPFDLTPSEARKIANVVTAMAVTD